MTRWLHRRLLKFAEFLLAHPFWVFGTLVASALISAALALTVKFDFTPQSIYRGNDELLAYADEFKKTFGYDEAILMVLVQATGPADVLSVPALQWQRSLGEQLKALPEVQRVDSVATLEIPRFTLRGGSPEPILNQEVVDEAGAQRVRDLLADASLVRGSLIDAENRVALMAVFLDPKSLEIETLRRMVTDVREVVKNNPPPEGYEYALSGLPQLRIEVVDDLMRDMATLMPIGGIVYLIVLAIMFRRLSGALLPLSAVGIGLSWTMATFAMTRDTLNLVSNILPILLMIIGVSSCVQIVTCYAEQSAKGFDRRRAARVAIARMAPPCLLAAITTAVGFASLATARSELLSRFGAQAAVGIGFQFVSTLLTLGALFRFFPAPTYVGMNEERPGIITRIVTMLGFNVARRAWLTMIGAGVIVSIAVWFGSGVIINTYAIRETFHEDHPSMKTFSVIEKRLSGIMPLEISLTARDPDAFLKPEVFHQVVRAEQQAKSIPGVLTALSYTDLVREVLKNWPGRRPTETDLQLIPESDVGTERLRRTVEFVRRFPEAFHYEGFVAPDGHRARIRLRLQEIGSRQTLELIRVLECQLAEIFPEGGPVEARLTGEGYVNAQALTILIRDLFYALLTASLVIFTLIALEFRSLRVGLIAALPNLTPLCITLGYMGVMGYDMNVANVIAFTICLGLADDNTIYFLYRFRHELESSEEPTEAVRRAFLGTGRAIVLTSLLLLVGMSVLIFSDFVPTRRFAELTSVTILGNLLGVLLLLPACLVLVWRKGSASKESST